MMKALIIGLCTSLSLFAQDHRQLMLVTTPDAEATQGHLYLYERDDTSLSWSSFYHPIPVFVGQTGLAWGIGLHEPQEGIQKREGDKKTPAGIFEIGTAFGFDEIDLKMDYLKLKPSHEAVDDPESRYYNTIQDRELVVCDWISAEMMYEQPLYKWGFEIMHGGNVPYAGSAIFAHLESGRGTYGCTSMSEEHLLTVLRWLDKEKRPIIVQLTEKDYLRLRDEWSLPQTLESGHK